MNLDPITSTELLGPSVSDVSVPHDMNAVLNYIFNLE